MVLNDKSILSIYERVTIITGQLAATIFEEKQYGCISYNRKDRSNYN